MSHGRLAFYGAYALLNLSFFYFAIPRLMVAQQPMRFWMLVVFLHGLVVLAGVIATVTHLLTLKPERAAAEEPLDVAAARRAAGAA